MTAFGVNSAVKNMLNMINGPHPAKGHVPIDLFEPVCGGLGPPVILGRKLIKVKIDINPAVHIGPGVINFNIRAGRLVKLFSQFRREGDLFGGVNSALIEFKRSRSVKFNQVKIKPAGFKFALAIRKGFTDPSAFFSFIQGGDSFGGIFGP